MYFIDQIKLKLPMEEYIVTVKYVLLGIFVITLTFLSSLFTPAYVNGSLPITQVSKDKIDINLNSTNFSTTTSYFTQTKTLDGYYPSSVSPDNELIALIGLIGGYTTGGKGDTAYIYNQTSGNIIYKLKHSDTIEGTAFSPDGSLITTASYDNYINVWNTKDGSINSSIRTGRLNEQVAFIPNSQLIAGTDANGYVRIINYNTGNISVFYNKTPEGSFGMSTLAVAPNGSFMATGGNSKSVVLWNISDLHSIVGKVVYHTMYSITSSTFSNDNHYLLVSDFSHIYIFDMTKNCSLVTTINPPTSGNTVWDISTLAGTSLVFISENGKFEIYDLETMQNINTYTNFVSSFPIIKVSLTNIYIGLDNRTEIISALPITIPTAPVSIKLTLKENNVISLSWNPPISNNGSEIIRYNIYKSVGTDNNFELIAYSNVLDYTDANVQAGNTYSYKISAVNGKGEGYLSSEQSITIPSPTSSNSQTSTINTSTTTSQQSKPSSSSLGSFTIASLFLVFGLVIVLRKKQLKNNK